ncbi:hypothetical protein KCU85_g230, partial [Aureobasidium melanogenum]
MSGHALASPSKSSKELFLNIRLPSPRHGIVELVHPDPEKTLGVRCSIKPDTCSSARLLLQLFSDGFDVTFTLPSLAGEPASQFGLPLPQCVERSLGGNVFVAIVVSDRAHSARKARASDRRLGDPLAEFIFHFVDALSIVTVRSMAQSSEEIESVDRSRQRERQENAPVNFQEWVRAGAQIIACKLYLAMDRLKCARVGGFPCYRRHCGCSLWQFNQ